MRTALELKKQVENGSMDSHLLSLYGQEALLAYERSRYAAALEEFIKLYGGQREAEIYSAPGRTEIGGNHTDHQRGQVLAAAVNLDVVAIVAKTEDGVLSIHSDGNKVWDDSVTSLLTGKAEEGTSQALVQGVMLELQKRGITPGGFVCYMTSDVLVGSGLSSSAAFENVIGNIVLGLFAEKPSDLERIDAVEIAKISQIAENVYFGKPCGLMDQMASSVGNLVHIDFNSVVHPLIDPIDVNFSESGYSLCIIDTKGSHADLTDEYAAIPQEMKQVASFFGKEVLSEVEEEKFYEKLVEVREALGDRAVLRSIHFFEETSRAGQEAEALRAGNFERFLQLVKQSGDSSYKFLQNIYSSKDNKNQGMAVAIALCEKYLGTKKGVVRVHGGGFAGTIQCFVKTGEIEKFAQYMHSVFAPDCCHVLYIRRDGGTRVM